MCLILLSPVAVYFFLIYKMFIAVYSELRKPVHPVCALASSIAQTPISPRWRSPLCTHSAGSFYRSNILLCAKSELLWWAPSSQEKDVCSVNQKWQFITVLWDREGKRGKWSWTIHYRGTVVSHYSPRNPDLQFLNALGWRRASFCFYCGSGRGERDSFILICSLCHVQVAFSVRSWEQFINHYFYLYAGFVVSQDGAYNPNQNGSISPPLLCC